MSRMDFIRGVKWGMRRRRNAGRKRWGNTPFGGGWDGIGPPPRRRRRRRRRSGRGFASPAGDPRPGMWAGDRFYKYRMF